LIAVIGEAIGGPAAAEAQNNYVVVGIDVLPEAVSNLST